MAFAPFRAQTRAAAYAQERRDNETQARKELLSRLSGLDNSAGLDNRGDFNITTKALVAVLNYIDEDARLPARRNRRGYNSRSAQYNQIRRNNESAVREELRKYIPDAILAECFMRQNNLNQTTKIVTAAALYLDVLGRDDTIEESSMKYATDELELQNNQAAFKTNLVSIDYDLESPTSHRNGTLLPFAIIQEAGKSAHAILATPPPPTDTPVTSGTMDMQHLKREFDLDVRPPSLKRSISSCISIKKKPQPGPIDTHIQADNATADDEPK